MAGWLIFDIFFYFRKTLRKRQKISSGTQKPKCGALAPALVHQPTPQKKGAQGPPRRINQAHLLTTKKITKKSQGNLLFNYDFFRRSGQRDIRPMRDPRRILSRSCSGRTNNARLLVLQNHGISLRDVRLRQLGLVQARWCSPVGPF